MIYSTTAEHPLVVTDPAWFTDMLCRMERVSVEPEVQLTCVSEGTQYWADQTMMKLVKADVKPHMVNINRVKANVKLHTVNEIW